MKLNNQMKQIIFRACPVDDRERGDSGWQIAMYLRKVVNDMKFAENYSFSPFTTEAHYGKNGRVDDGLCYHNLYIAGKISKCPRVLVPHEIQFTRHH